MSVCRRWAFPFGAAAGEDDFQLSIDAMSDGAAGVAEEDRLFNLTAVVT
jgi:hypothetical protein